jgi:hypothetical protein
METHYWGETNLQSWDLIPVNQFWVDYAQYLLAQGAGPFLTAAFTESYDERQTILAVALLDLPDTLEKSHDFNADEGSGIVICTAGNVIMFKK